MLIYNGVIDLNESDSFCLYYYVKVWPQDNDKKCPAAKKYINGLRGAPHNEGRGAETYTNIPDIDLSLFISSI